MKTDEEIWIAPPNRQFCNECRKETRKQVLEEVDKQFKKIWAECPIDGFTVWHWENKVLKKLKPENAPLRTTDKERA